MYTPQDEKRLYEQAKNLLSAADAHSSEKVIAQLKEVINYADWKYYVQSEPVLADFEYDTLFKKLKHIEQNGLCAICKKELPLKYSEMDRTNASAGYTRENTRLLHRECHVADQAANGYR